MTFYSIRLYTCTNSKLNKYTLDFLNIDMCNSNYGLGIIHNSPSWLVKNYTINTYIHTEKNTIHLPRVRTPVHSINLGKVSPECATCTHLYSTNWFHVAGGLHQACVTCCFPCILGVHINKIMKTFFLF